MKGGGHPTDRAVREQIKKCQDPEWYPGKRAPVSGRPPVVTGHQKMEIARVAMELKLKRKRAPTPALVRAKLPRLTLNRDSGQPLSDDTFHRIFKTHCYDKDEDDPWQWLACPSQDYLPDFMKPLRVQCAEHITLHFSPGAWVSHVAIDPCSTLLPRTVARLEEQQVAAMGKVSYKHITNILASPASCLPTFSDTFRHFPTLSDTFGHFPTLSDTFRYFPTLSDTCRHFRTLSDTFRHFPTLSDTFRHFPTLSDTVGKGRKARNR